MQEEMDNVVKTYGKVIAVFANPGNAERYARQIGDAYITKENVKINIENFVEVFSTSFPMYDNYSETEFQGMTERTLAGYIRKGYPLLSIVL